MHRRSVEIMKLLVLAPDYPKPGRPLGGAFNERSVAALKELCDYVEVLAPRPLAPPMLASLSPRWRIHTSTPSYQIVNDVSVYRPWHIQIPRFGGAFCVDFGAFLCCRGVARKMHRRAGFDAILSFDLLVTGGLAWRMGKDLGIPAIGWATGGDVRYPARSSYGRSVIRALKLLDLVFYQSHELLGKGADLLGVAPAVLKENGHRVLPRGIDFPPSLPKKQRRKTLRSSLGVSDDQVLVVNIGRVDRDKGVLDLVDAVSMAANRNPNIACIMVGSTPGSDDTRLVLERLRLNPNVAKKVALLPACNHDEIWDYLCAADIFVFTSHHEGMPNSLLEAMVMGVPAISFAIPPVSEIDAGLGALLLVPPFDVQLFSEAILRLADSPQDRARIAEIGRRRVQDHYLVSTNMAEVIAKLRQLMGNRCRPSQAEPISRLQSVATVKSGRSCPDQ